jgi:hypothetical protein
MSITVPRFGSQSYMWYTWCPDRVPLLNIARNSRYSINLVSTLLGIYLLTQLLLIYIVSHISTPTFLILYFFCSLSNNYYPCWNKT